MTVNYKRKNGEVFSGETGVYYLKDRTGEVVGLIGVIRDVTARIQAEQAIENERAYLSAVIDNIGEAIVICDAEGRIVRFNETARRLHGLPEKPIPSDQWAEHFDLYQEDGITPLPMKEIPLFRALQGERVQDAEIAVAPKHSRPYHLVCSGQALTDERGKITGAVVAMHDITDRKQKEKSLRQSESYYRAIFETAGTSMVILDKDTTIAYANSNFEDLSGYSRQELEGKKYGTDFVHPEDVEWMKDYHYQRLHDPGSVPSIHECRLIVRGGDIRRAYMTVGMIAHTTQSILSLVDITPRKEAEESLQAAHDKLDTLVQLNIEGLMVLDREGIIQFINPAAAKMLRREQEELLGEEFGHITPNSSSEIELLSETGETNIVELRATETEWSGQSALLATFRDITERKHAEEELRKSREELEAIYNNAPLILLLLDSEQLVRKANRHSTDFIGVSEESLIGRHVGEVLHCVQHMNHPEACGSKPECEECTFHNTIMESFRNGESFNQVEATLSLLRGEEELNFTFLISSMPLQHQGEPMVLLALVDITERKVAEESLRRLSFSDTLTGLYNRNFFEEEMNRLSDGRYSPIGIIIFNVDGLKHINDTLGHESGDNILITVADILKENLRDSDIIARIGGDEFAVLLPDIDQDGMKSIVQRVRSSVEQFNNTQGQIPLSVSMGQAVSEVGETDMPALLKEADNRMYGEKMQRRQSSHR